MTVQELEEFLYERGYITTNGAAQSKIYEIKNGKKKSFIGRIWHKDVRTSFLPLNQIEVDEVVLLEPFKELASLILILGLPVEVVAANSWESL